MTSRALLLIAFALIPGVALSQNTSPIDGVWRITEVVTTGANAVTNASPQPSLIIFTRGHFSWVSVTGRAPRAQSPPPKDAARPTDADKIALFDEWRPFVAQSGTFEVKGTTVTRHALVAKNVDTMSPGNSDSREFTIEGDTLWLISRAPAGQPASETRTKLTRVR